MGAGEGEGEGAAREQAQVQQVGDVIWEHQEWAVPLGQPGYTHAVQEELALGREAGVEDVVQQRDGQALGRQVSHNEEEHLPRVALAGLILQVGWSRAL